MKKLLTVAAVSFVLGSTMVMAQTAAPNMTGATPPNAGASTPTTIDPKAKKPAPMPGMVNNGPSGAMPPNAGASTPTTVDPKAKKPAPVAGMVNNGPSGAMPPNAGASTPTVSEPKKKK